MQNAAPLSSKLGSRPRCHGAVRGKRHHDQNADARVPDHRGIQHRICCKAERYRLYVMAVATVTMPRMTLGTRLCTAADLLDLLISICVHLQLAQRNLVSPLLQALADVVHASVFILQQSSHVQALQLLPKTCSPDEAVLTVVLALAVGFATAGSRRESRRNKAEATDNAWIPANTNINFAPLNCHIHASSTEHELQRCALATSHASFAESASPAKACWSAQQRWSDKQCPGLQLTILNCCCSQTQLHTA